MKPITLCPTTLTRKTMGVSGVLACVGAVALSGWVMSLSGGVILVLGASGAFLATLALRRSHGTGASFAADASGFSVMGKGPHPWQSYNGVSACAARIGRVPMMEWVVVEVASAHGPRRLRIRPSRLSGSAVSMAARISTYAAYAQRADDLAAALSALPAAPLIGQPLQASGCRRANPMPTAAFEHPMSDRPCAKRGHAPTQSGGWWRLPTWRNPV